MKWWFRRKPEHVIPNPRDSKRRRYAMEAFQVHTLMTLQGFVFALAILILIEVW